MHAFVSLVQEVHAWGYAVLNEQNPSAVGKPSSLCSLFSKWKALYNGPPGH